MRKQFGAHRALLLTALMGASLGAIGGGQRAGAGPPNANTGKAAPSKGASLPSGDVARLRQALAAARGKVVLVNFWATWCGPCVEEFPDLVRLHDRYKSKGLTLLAISADYDKNRDVLVADFLAKHKATFPTFLKPQGDDMAYINQIDPAWEGGMPRTYLLDRNGNVRQIVNGAINPTQVDAAIRKLLAEKPAAKKTAAKNRKSLLGGA